MNSTLDNTAKTLLTGLESAEIVGGNAGELVEWDLIDSRFGRLRAGTRNGAHRRATAFHFECGCSD